MIAEQTPARGAVPLAAAVTFLGFLDTHLLLPVLALYAAGLGAAPGIVGLVIGLYSITNTLANIFFGRLVDRIGGKLPLVAGLFADALSMFLYSICRLPIHLALVRAFHGISGGLVGPATMSITAGQATAGKKARTMSTYGIALATATLVGYGVGGLIVNRLGYPALFFLGAALLIAGAVISFFLPDDRGKPRPPAETSTRTTSVRNLLGRRGLLVAYCAIFAQYFTFGGVVTLLPLYLNDLGMGALYVGILLATFAVFFIAVQFPGGTISDRAGRKFPIIAGLGLGAASLAVLSSLQALPLLAAAMALYGVAYGLLFPSVSALIVDNTTPGERGAATGIFHALITSGVAIGAPVIGWAGELVGVRTGLTLTAVIMVLALVVTLVISTRRWA